MDHYKYIIIGGGMTGDAAVKGIREIDKDGSIAMISLEAHPPYSRPPLTKGLWKNTLEEKIWKKTEDQNVNLILNSKAERIGIDRSVSLASGEKLHYDKLLLATGGLVNKLPFSGNNIIYYRTYDDYKRLRQLAENKNDFVVVGGGFIGSEIAAALAMNGKKVKMIFPDKLICGKIFPKDLAEFINSYYKGKGIELINEDIVKDIRNHDDKEVITTRSGKTLTADAVVAGIGIKPNTKLAEQASITVDNGIVVSELLKTNYPNIFAAGDAANFYNPLLDKRIRVEHEDNANKMGKHAGRAMAGDEVPYEYLPFFYSDLFELGYEAVGELDSSLVTYSDWKEKFSEGVVYYLAGDQVRGVLLWNVWGQIDEARKMIGETGHFNLEDLKGRLPVKK